MPKIAKNKRKELFELFVLELLVDDQLTCASGLKVEKHIGTQR